MPVVRFSSLFEGLPTKTRGPVTAVQDLVDDQLQTPTRVKTTTNDPSKTVQPADDPNEFEGSPPKPEVLLVTPRFFKGTQSYVNKVLKLASDVSAPIQGVVPMVPGGVVGAYGLAIGGVQFLGKAPTTMATGVTYDVLEAVRLHTAVLRIADRIGATEMVAPAIGLKAWGVGGNVKDGDPMFVTPYLDKFYLFVRIGAKHYQKVQEETRLAGALIDFVTVNTDRQGIALLMNGEGKISLTCNDMVFGRSVGDPNRSVFFPEGALEFKSDQDKFGNLPKAMADFVESVVAMEVSGIQHNFELEVDEAKLMKDKCVKIRQKGLSEAIEEGEGVGWKMPEKVKSPSV